ncbi:N-acyl-D-amino-acid deacylase family protein [Rhodopila sp.]|jgi:N-acyl-D-aspartate/D-glutamate deacylase|uniref:N-acyl-D-amino-acid deacylase family protein n=1 Tax=Rhodopila sp. TaxID=2480087 RepID=UPI002C8BDFE8|nr:amidohydrolase family protein [Rhodopila sp.]HVZ07025.1 amidohydrolase family protein [Rhodopila sp.]
MADDLTLVIRGGLVVDGTGAAPREADIGLAGDRIVAIGRIAGRGAEEIDARGKIVTPGFVDPHTHYDAQVMWANHITPSSCNGVTTALIGNCGVGFAPCKPDQRDMLVELMEGVEDIPEPVLTQGLPWNWESFPDYLDRIAERRFDIDVAAQVPHAALRVFVMGERGVAREPATEVDRQAMARLAAEGIRAGALGFSTSRTLNHKTLDGRPTPTLNAAEEELTTIAKAVGETGSGWLQVISDFDEAIEAEFAMFRRLVEISGRPMTTTVLERDSKPQEWRRLLDLIGQANADGIPITGMVLTRPTGIMLGFEISQNPFVDVPGWDTIADLPFDAKIAALRDPGLKARLLSETPRDPALVKRLRRWDRIFPLGDPPDYEPAPERSIAAEAARLGVDPAALAYDRMLENDGRTILYRPLSNYADGTLETVREMMAHPNTLIGLGDGGAHVSILCDATAMTYGLTHWTRDRAQGRFPIEWMVRRLTHDNAKALGLTDRGVIAAGRKADINVIDYDRLNLRAPKVIYDLPAGGRRLMQVSDGFTATILSGEIVSRDGQATGRLPGRLLRGAPS